MGKSLGSDITEGKQTLMVIKARNEYPDKWNDIISSSCELDLFNNICKFFNKTGILEESRSKTGAKLMSKPEAMTSAAINQPTSVAKEKFLSFFSLIAWGVA